MAGFPKVRMAYSVPPKDADPRESAIYSLAEAALFLGVPRTTLKDWTEPHFYKKLGNTDSLIAPVGYATDLETGKDVAWLSFYNLSEAHVLSSLTRFEGVKMMRVRDAMTKLRELQLSDDKHPLLSKEMYADKRDLFIKTIEKRKKLLTNLSQGGQLGFPAILDQYLHRLVRDPTTFKPVKIYPQKQSGTVVSIVLTISSGRPIVDRTGLPVSSLWNRYRAGDSPDFLADDYDLNLDEVKGALDYCEQRAA
ncbi:MAG: DUF433 domain-containing protein [Terracidiphilus sp.]